MIRAVAKSIHGLFFSFLILSIPLNLGFHFISPDFYVNSKLIDYLIPTLWFQDILIVFILMFWILSSTFKKTLIIKIFQKNRILFLFLIALLPSLVLAPKLISAFYVFLRIVLYVLFAIYVSNNVALKTDFPKIIKLLSLVLILLGILAILQWKIQGSVFNNYLFFGEQPYSWSTFNVARTNFLGYLKIPSYGTFRHPNVFAGFLSIAVFWIYALLESKINSEEYQILLKTAFVFGFISLVLTFSQIGMFALFLAMISFLLTKKLSNKIPEIILFLLMSVFICGLFIPVISEIEFFSNDPSFYRRSNLLKSAFFMMEEKPFIGSGLNNFTVVLENYLPMTQVLRFTQPVHNIFVLIFAESGIFVLIFYFSILFYCFSLLFRALQEGQLYAGVFIGTLLQIFVLGSFDHYLYTIHQTQILFWLTVGLSLSYTKRDAKV